MVFLCVGYSSEPSHTLFPFSLGARHIQDCFKKKSGRIFFIKSQHERARHQEHIKRSKVIVQAKLVVGYLELKPMESGAGFLDLQDAATVRVTKEILETKKQGTSWLMEYNWPILKKAVVNSWYPSVRVHCDKAYLGLGLDSVSKQKYSMLYRVLAGS